MASISNTYQSGGVYASVSNGDSENGVDDSSHNPFMKKSSLMAFGTAIILGVFALIPAYKQAKIVKPANTYEGKLFDELNRYIFEDYDSKPTFSNFLPGVAGIYGKPMWSFYVNRGQGFSSFGTDSKDYPILEFNSANKAYISTPYRAFRTFIKAKRDGKIRHIEPFSPKNTRSSEKGTDNEGYPKRFMFVGTNEMEITESDSETGLDTSVTYFLLPNEDFGSFVRRTTIKNTASTPIELELLDGLAKIEPAGGQLDFMLKNMGRTLEGWMGVYHAEDKKEFPFYRLSTQPSDTASVQLQDAGHFVLSFADDDLKLLPIVYDSTKVFGRDTSLTSPWGFVAAESVDDIVKGTQYGAAATSSSFAAAIRKIGPGESLTINTLYGKAGHIDDVPKISNSILKKDWVLKKLNEAREMMNNVTAAVTTNTGSHLFNGAVKQMYMDNGLRGGLPVILGDVDEAAKLSNSDEDQRLKVFHVYSRIHGDLERDYNSFHIDPSYFSQGPGNYRDVAQNRRNDVVLQPRVASFDIKMFLSYIQADGYEPLTVEAIAFYMDSKEKCLHVANRATADKASTKTLTNILCGGTFRPGQLFQLIEQLDVTLSIKKEEFVDLVASEAQYTPMGVFGQGYWADHWDYYLDFIEAYLMIYPDGEENLMYDNELRYFYGTATVKPRSEKYILTYTFDAESKHVQQLDATEWDEEKVQQKKKFFNPKTGLFDPLQADWQHQMSDGDVFKSAPIVKLFLLATTKYTMRDAYGMGVEYEGGKPGWNDAMNGLVGMVGSGMPETYELLVLLKYVRKVVSTYKRAFNIPSELMSLVVTTNEALDELTTSGYKDNFGSLSMSVPDELFVYWNKTATAREEYRASVRLAFSGQIVELPADFVVATVTRWIEQVEIGIKRALEIGSGGDGDDGTFGVSPCYFSYDVTGWVLNGGHSAMGLPTVDATSMKVGVFPLFLEGPVRHMKTVGDTDAQRDVYNRVIKTGLRDSPLQMYTLSASLKGQSYDMGRMMAFSPGWLENQSIWTHMSYKYYLQLLRGGLYNEFFSEMKNGGMLPFMDPIRYGRSLMECSSFMASSAFVDPSMHGRGFLARLSGSTAEFLSMYVLMMMGPNLFFMNESKELNFQLKPAIPFWLFESDTKDTKESEEISITFKMFGSIDVTLHNGEQKDLFGIPPKGYKIAFADGSVVSESGPAISSVNAKKIRKVILVTSIDAYF